MSCLSLHSAHIICFILACVRVPCAKSGVPASMVLLWYGVDAAWFCCGVPLYTVVTLRIHACAQTRGVDA